MEPEHDRPDDMPDQTNATPDTTPPPALPAAPRQLPLKAPVPPDQKAAETALAQTLDPKEYSFMRYYLGIDPPTGDHRLQGNILGSMIAAGYDRERGHPDIIRQGHRIIRKAKTPLEVCLATLDIDGHTLATSLAEGLQAQQYKEFMHQRTGEIVVGQARPDHAARTKYLQMVLAVLGHGGKRAAQSGPGPAEDYQPPPRPAKARQLFSEGGEG